MSIPTSSDIPLHGWFPYHLIHRERINAHRKHDDKSMEREPWNSNRWLPVLVEEVGEVAHEITEHGPFVSNDELQQLAKELIQVAAMATAWFEAVTIELRDRQQIK